MIELLPEGKSIGWMQAPPQWIFTHTVRFVGIVRVVIQDGEGFILIRRGRPLAYYFRHGRIELRGHAALDYFNSHPTIEFNLCKYTPEELGQALRICNIDEQVPEPDLVTPGAEPYAVPAPEKVTVPVTDSPEKTSPDTTEKEVMIPVYEKPVITPPATLDEPDMKLLGQIKKLNGIVAISVFDEERNIILVGDVEIEPLLNLARKMLETTKKITPCLDWGSFVHMTLQIPEANVIIAPYRDYHICLLTTRTINIGHIRRILRDLQQARESQ